MNVNWYSISTLKSTKFGTLTLDTGNMFFLHIAVIPLFWKPDTFTLISFQVTLPILSIIVNNSPTSFPVLYSFLKKGLSDNVYTDTDGNRYFDSQISGDIGQRIQYIGLALVHECALSACVLWSLSLCRLAVWESSLRKSQGPPSHTSKGCFLNSLTQSLKMGFLCCTERNSPSERKRPLNCSSSPQCVHAAHTHTHTLFHSHPRKTPRLHNAE